MGYTHYWRKTPTLPRSKWGNFENDVTELLYDAPSIVCEEYDNPNSLAVVNDDVVKFNGRDKDGHETFYFEREQVLRERDRADEHGRYFNFCKTAQKHYDIYVVAVLELAKLHFGEAIEVSSDGDKEELKAGIELAKEYYNCGFDIYK